MGQVKHLVSQLEITRLCREFDVEALTSLSVCKEQLTAHIIVLFIFYLSCCWMLLDDFQYKMCVDDRQVSP
jgi:hypothetical protein